MDISRYLAKSGEKVDLTQWPTACDVDIDKKKVKEELLDQNVPSYLSWAKEIIKAILH